MITYLKGLISSLTTRNSNKTLTLPSSFIELSEEELLNIKVGVPYEI